MGLLVTGLPAALLKGVVLGPVAPVTGDVGSTLIKLGTGPRCSRSDWDRTTGGMETGSVCSMLCTGCRMMVLAGLLVCATGMAVTHTGLGWIAGLLLRIILAFRELVE